MTLSLVGLRDSTQEKAAAGHGHRVRVSGSQHSPEGVRASWLDSSTVPRVAVGGEEHDRFELVEVDQGAVTQEAGRSRRTDLQRIRSSETPPLRTRKPGGMRLLSRPT